MNNGSSTKLKNNIKHQPPLLSLYTVTKTEIRLRVMSDFLGAVYNHHLQINYPLMYIVTHNYNKDTQNMDIKTFI